MVNEIVLPPVDIIFAGAKEDIGRVAGEHGDRDVLDEILKERIGEAFGEVQRLETAARSPDRWKALEFDGSSVMLVRFSAPGTYYRAYKDDRYKDYEWAAWLDRTADDTAACLGIVLVGNYLGIDFSGFEGVGWLDHRDEGRRMLVPDVRKAIMDSNIRFAYFGRNDEGAAIEKVLSYEDAFVPREAVTVFGVDSIDNTVDQVRHLKSFLAQRVSLGMDGKVVLVDFAPRLIRALRMIEEQMAVPSELELKVFPVATPKIESSRLIELEVRGAVGYYAWIGEAAVRSPDYEVLGE